MSSRPNPKPALAKRPRPGRPKGATSLDPELARLFGDLVRELRAAAGASQEQTAFTAEMERSYFGRIERGESQPTLLALLKIAWALGIEANQLVLLLEQRLGESPRHR
jgi:transcriptional regulator with XRE-family HTH domain